MTCCKYSITCQDDLLTVDNEQSHVTAFRPISEAARSWSDDNIGCGLAASHGTHPRYPGRDVAWWRSEPLFTRARLLDVRGRRRVRLPRRVRRRRRWGLLFMLERRDAGVLPQLRRHPGASVDVFCAAVGRWSRADSVRRRRRRARTVGESIAQLTTLTLVVCRPVSKDTVKSSPPEEQSPRWVELV